MRTDLNRSTLNEVTRMKEIMGLLTEQVITDYDGVYDYKKEGDKYYTKRKDSESWYEAKGSSLDAIKTKVFGDETTPTPQVSKPTSNDVDIESVELPFKNREEGDRFRGWINDNYPKFAKQIDLDRSGSHNNDYIKKAWEVYGKEYESQYLEVNPNTQPKEDGFIMGWLRKKLPFLAQLIDAKNLTNSDFTDDHIDVIKNVVKNAKDRIKNFRYGQTYGTIYEDYDNFVAEILDKKGQSWTDIVRLYFHDSDKFDVSTTLGRFSFNIKENGKISVYDEYDFTKQYEITREDLDWENTNTLEKILNIMELGNGEIGIYGAIRHLAYLNNPQGGVNQSLTVNLNIDDPSIIKSA